MKAKEPDRMTQQIVIASRARVVFLSLISIFALPDASVHLEANLDESPARSAEVAAHDQPASLSPKEITQRYGEAVVLLLATDRSGQPRRLGSGIFVTEDGLLATNLHVARGLSQVRVRLQGGVEEVTDSVVGYSVASDLLLLRVEIPQTPHVVLGDSDVMSSGDAVVVISNPEGLERSVSTGVISGIRSLDSLRKVIQFTAPVSAGSSGGAVFNERGEVIGIVSSQMVDGQNLNFGVPVNDLKPLMKTSGTLRLNEIESGSPPAVIEQVELEGVWNGLVTNFSVGVSSALQVTLKLTGSRISGQVLVSKPLYGSGSIDGHVDADKVQFRSVGEGFTIDWEGQLRGNRIAGSYTVVRRFFKQRGTWWAVK